MNLIKYILLYVMLIKETISLSVKNTQKFCINCKYFVLRNVYDYDNSIIGKTSKCSKFVTKNLVSGVIIEEFALKCRNNNYICGTDAKYFTLKNRYDSDDIPHIEEMHVLPHTIVDEWFILRNISTCVDCKFGIPHIANDPFEERDPIEYNYRCQKFVNTDIVSGKEENKLANECRNNEKLCGINAKFFIRTET